MYNRTYRKPVKNKYMVVFKDGVSKEVLAIDGIEAEHISALSRKKLGEPTSVKEVRQVFVGATA
jgi:hypothetical protein